MQRPCIISSLVVLLCAMTTARAETTFTFGRFGAPHVFVPKNVEHVAMLFSDMEGWDATDEQMAKTLANEGILVAGIDLRHYAAELAKPRDKCSYLAGEFEDFSHELQKHFSPQRYHMPVLIGTGRAAGLVYGVTAQGSSGTFVGVATISFQPKWQPLIRLCQSYGLRYDTNKDGSIVFKPTEQLSTPWISLRIGDQQSTQIRALDAFVKKVGTAKAYTSPNEERLRAQLVNAVEELVAPDREAKVVADELRDLPLEEVRAKSPSSTLAIFLTGDGGWAEIDKGVSAELAKHGIDVVALSSLQYFWKPRSPEQTANDVARVMRHYIAALKKRDVILIGYSFGADVGAFVINRLPPDLRSTIVSANFLGLAETADFEVHVTTWLGVDHHGLATRPEVERLTLPVLCVYGAGENDSLCTKLSRPNIQSRQIGDGHHFGDKYADIAEQIVSLYKSQASARP